MSAAEKKRVEQEIASWESRLFELEGKLLQEPCNIVTGFAGFHKQNLSSVKPNPNVDPAQRIFSLSSHTSPAYKANAAKQH